MFGWRIVQALLDGAHDVDTHFVETNPRHNLPVLAALTDVWNDAFLGSSGRYMTPFVSSMQTYPSYCAALESQVCGNSPAIRNQHCGHIVDGGLHGSYDRLALQGSRGMPTEAVMAMDTQAVFASKQRESVQGLAVLEREILLSQDALLCSMFGYLDELAYGDETHQQLPFDPVPQFIGQSAGVPMTSSALPAPPPRASIPTSTPVAESNSNGNRPSTLLMCDKCDAFACGQLIAFAEHRAAVKAKLWNSNPFPMGSAESLWSNRADELKEQFLKLMDGRAHGSSDEQDVTSDDRDEDAMAGTNFSTQTLLANYASRSRNTG